MSVTIVLNSQAAPGNTDEYANVTSMGTTSGGMTALTTSTAPNATDQYAAIVALGTATFVVIVYTDPNGTQQRRVIRTGDIKTII